MARELMKYPSVANWLNRMGEGSKQGYHDRFAMFMRYLPENGGKFSHMNPDELIDYMRNESLTRRESEDMLDLVQGYINHFTGLREWTLKARYTGIRSFFAHNRAGLKRDKTFIIRPDKPPVEGTLTPENVRDVVNTSNQTYKAVFLCMFQSGMGRAEFEYWNLNGWTLLKKELEENKSFITVKLPGRKKNLMRKPYSTYVYGDSLKALKAYIPERAKAEENHARNVESRRKFLIDNPHLRGAGKYVKKPFNPNAIFYSNWGSPILRGCLYEYWQGALGRASIRIPVGDSNPRNRYGDNPHEMRDVFRSQWEKTEAKESVGEYLMGHAGDKLGYNKAHKDQPWVKSELTKAMDYLNVMSSPVALGLITKEEHDKEIAQKLQEANAEIARLNDLVSGETVTKVDAMSADMQGLITKFNALEKVNKTLREEVERQEKKDPE